MTDGDALASIIFAAIILAYWFALWERTKRGNYDDPEQEPEHPNCRCVVQWVASDDGERFVGQPHAMFMDDCDEHPGYATGGVYDGAKTFADYNFHINAGSGEFLSKAMRDAAPKIKETVDKAFRNGARRSAGWEEMRRFINNPRVDDYDLKSPQDIRDDIERGLASVKWSDEIKPFWYEHPLTPELKRIHELQAKAVRDMHEAIEEKIQAEICRDLTERGRSDFMERAQRDGVKIDFTVDGETVSSMLIGGPRGK